MPDEFQSLPIPSIPIEDTNEAQKAGIRDALGVSSSRSTVESNVLITGLVGGTATDLDSTATINLSPGKTFILPSLVIGANIVSKTWCVISGTSATDLPNGIVRPVDYAPGTNEKIIIAI